MTFPTPTSIEELLAFVKEIYDYYNGRWYAYQPLELDDLVVSDKVYNAPTDAELSETVNEIVQNKISAKKEVYDQEIQSKIDCLTAKLNGIEQGKNNEIALLNSSYEALEEKVKQSAVKRGLGESTFLITSLAELENKKLEKQAEIENAYANRKLDLSAELIAYQNKLQKINQRFTAELEYERKKLLQEMKTEREKKLDEVFSYNNALKEKRIRYANSIKQQKMNDNLRYIQIVEEALSEEELEHIGYFKDLIVLCDDYFYSLEKEYAYELFLRTGELQFYLKKYYSSLSSKYLARKNNT